MFGKVISLFFKYLESFYTFSNTFSDITCFRLYNFHERRIYMKETELRKILSVVCDNYVDSILTDLEDDVDLEKKLPFTIACVNFICELKKKNIIVELYDTFEDTIIDRISREISSYIVE